MQRIAITPRAGWQKKVEDVGLIYHTTSEGKIYWNESAYYKFNSKQIDDLESATNELEDMCLKAGQYIIDNNRFKDLWIPDDFVNLIKRTWDSEPPAVYGRFDLAYDGINPPKLLEYNADTPTALLEASVVQWYWLQDSFPQQDQFNSIHERLVAKWKELLDYIKDRPLYFVHSEDLEDLMTVTYLRDTAEEAGFTTTALLMKDIGWDSKHLCFADLDNKPMKNIFKLYPWEWMIHEEFSQHIITVSDQVQWIEPIWKMMFSNKGILPILWELYPNHPYLLESYLGSPKEMKEYAKKPLLSREGSNVTIVTKDTQQETGGDYGEEGYIYQAYSPLPDFDGFHPVIGSWVIDCESHGMGIRESQGLITDNTSTFVPHLFEH